MTTMRAKMIVNTVTQNRNADDVVTQEQLKFNAVSAKSYPADGSDEDNSFAKFSPSAELSITVANPALFDKFKAGDKFYVDFTPAE